MHKIALGRVAIGDKNRMLRHSLRREVIFSLQHFIAPALDLMPCTIPHMSYNLRRLVNLTDEDDRKLGLNMTETDEPYLIYQKYYPVNVRRVVMFIIFLVVFTNFGHILSVMLINLLIK